MNEQETTEKRYTLESLYDLLNQLQDDLFHKLKYPDREPFKILMWATVRIRRWNQQQPKHLDELDTFIIKAYKERGYTYEEIAFILDRSTGTIFDYCKHHGLTE